MTQVACERGTGNVAVANIVQRAGVSRRTFYEEFDDSEACMLAALDQALDTARTRVLSVYDESQRWRERIRAALAELLRLFDEQPQLARLLVVVSLSAGPPALERRAKVLEQLAALVDAGRDEGSAGGVTWLTAEGVVGAVLSVIHTRLSQGEGGQLSELLNPLMSTIVLPYLGASQARRELDKPSPARTSAADENGDPFQADPFKEAGMRITYRTMLVLTIIAANPGASNRRIGEAAGVGDQGQMSKLLARLERLGLIAKGGSGHVKGEANAWSLTSAGRRLEQSIHAHTSSTENKQQQGRV